MYKKIVSLVPSHSRFLVTGSQKWAIAINSDEEMMSKYSHIDCSAAAWAILREVAMHPQTFWILIYDIKGAAVDVTGQLIKLFVNKSLWHLTNKILEVFLNRTLHCHPCFLQSRRFRGVKQGNTNVFVRCTCRKLKRNRSRQVALCIILVLPFFPF